jgi:DNA-3-methyladenine glycosylase I
MEEKNRCNWCVGIDLYEKYHDEEWGVPVYDDQKLFEFLLLETFQAGLSWITILKKRENFRVAFDHFDYSRIDAKCRYHSKPIENSRRCY